MAVASLMALHHVAVRNAGLREKGSLRAMAYWQHVFTVAIFIRYLPWPPLFNPVQPYSRTAVQSFTLRRGARTE